MHRQSRNVFVSAYWSVLEHPANCEAYNAAFCVPCETGYLACVIKFPLHFSLSFGAQLK